ncbi:MAG TPA: PqiC family protein [Usitatibacter sp.]|nr:PqiC family protein [Usitatibacter sp.]
MMRWIAALGAALLACACGTEPKIDFYSLSAPPAPSAPAAPASTLAIHIGPVTVPDAVDRPQMVIRHDDNRADIDDQHRWIEPIKSAIPRLLADAIARELNTPNVLTSRQSSALDIDYRVAIDVQHFDSSPGEISEDVMWTIRSRKTQAPRLGRTSVREAAAPGAEGIAAAHSRALARVAHDIAEAIRAMEAK